MSLSDVLFEAQKGIVGEIDVDDNSYADIRLEVEKLLEQMDAIRFLPGLDTPPGREAPPRRTAGEIITSFHSKDEHVEPGVSWCGGFVSDSFLEMLTEEDREALRRLKERNDQLWLEIFARPDAERTGVRLHPLRLQSSCPRLENAEGLVAETISQRVPQIAEANDIEGVQHGDRRRDGAGTCPARIRNRNGGHLAVPLPPLRHHDAADGTVDDVGERFRLHAAGIRRTEGYRGNGTAITRTRINDIRAANRAVEIVDLDSADQLRADHQLADALHVEADVFSCVIYALNHLAPGPGGSGGIMNQGLHLLDVVDESECGHSSTLGASL